MGISLVDEPKDLAVGQNDVASPASVRQSGKSDPPGIPVLNALVMARGERQGRAQRVAKAVDGSAGLTLPSRPSRHLRSSFEASN